MPKPRKPIESHLLEGTYRADRHGDVIAQILPVGKPVKPAGLSIDGEKLWDFIVEELASHGVAKRIDTILLGEMCQWYGRYRRASEKYDAVEPTTKKSSGLLRQSLESWREFDKAASRFGLTPADRAKLRITDKPAVDDGVMVRKRA